MHRRRGVFPLEQVVGLRAIPRDRRTSRRVLVGLNHVLLVLGTRRFARPISTFDMERYLSAVDEERRARGLTWAASTRELNEPFAHRAGIPPIAASTLTGMRAKGGLDGNVVVHTLMWLRRSPEEFAVDHPVPPKSLPALEQGFPPRWNDAQLCAAVDAERVARRLTWAGAANQVGERGGRYSDGSLRNLKVGFPAVMGLLAWLERHAADFVVNVAVEERRNRAHRRNCLGRASRANSSVPGLTWSRGCRT